MKTDKVLFIDTETGGIDPSENSLLSIAFVVWQDFNILDSKEILINDGVFNVTSEALAINGIDIELHKLVSLPPLEVISEMKSFLELHFGNEEKIILGGHNINFDVNFFKSFLNKNSFSFHKHFSHRYVDTATILYYLYLAGKIKQKTISSQEAFDFFGINVDNRHSALGDALATAKLFSILLKLISKNTKIKKTTNLNSPGLFD